MNLAAALPLTPAERKIAPSARAILIHVETEIALRAATLKTTAAQTSFWGSLRSFATRNYTAATTDNGTITPGAPPAQTAARTRSRTKAVAKTPARRSRGAGAAS
jgi:hypothetical protein